MHPDLSNVLVGAAVFKHLKPVHHQSSVVLCRLNSFGDFTDVGSVMSAALKI